MSTPIIPPQYTYRPIHLVDELGEYARLPDGAVINIGGVAGPNFTVDGRALLFADGTTTDGSGTVGSQLAVKTYEHIQATPSDVWTIVHLQNSRRVQISVWDENDELLMSDTTKIIDVNTVIIHYNTPATGRAILMLF